MSKSAASFSLANFASLKGPRRWEASMDSSWRPVKMVGELAELGRTSWMETDDVTGSSRASTDNINNSDSSWSRGRGNNSA